MAQPTNTYDTYDIRATDGGSIREDLADAIYDISPEETVFLSAIGKTTARDTYHMWQTDALETTVHNSAAIEGDDASAEAISKTIRLGNYTQIIQKTVRVSDTEAGVNHAGKSREMALQIAKKAKEIKLNTEAAMLANVAQNAGNSTTARTMAGVPTWLTTNVDRGATGASATGDGSDTATDGTLEPLTQTRMDNVLQSVWVAGGTPDTVLLSASSMNTALTAITGNNNQRSTIRSEAEKVFNSFDIYVTPWGSVTYKPSRNIRLDAGTAGRDIYVLDTSMWSVATLRGMKNTELAKTGDSTVRQLLHEVTLVCKNEAANGVIADVTQ